MPSDRVAPGPTRTRLIAVAAGLAFTAGSALAQPAANRVALGGLEPNLPLEIEDAVPIAPGARELQLPLVLDREQDGDYRWRFEPRMAWGFAPRWQTALALPLIAGSGDRTNSGTVRGEVMYQFLQEAGPLPAMAVLGRLDLPTGKNADGLDTAIKLLATKTLGEVAGTHQVHLNAAWRRNSQPRPGERSDTGRLAVGYSTLLAPRTVVAADIRRGHDREGSGTSGWVYELGIRQLLTPGTVLALGVGGGDGGDSPSWRLSAGLQTTF